MDGVPSGRKLIRFTLVSVVSTIVSVFVLSFVYELEIIRSEVEATLIGNLVGAMPSYGLNRRWTWGNTGNWYSVGPIMAREPDLRRWSQSQQRRQALETCWPSSIYQEASRHLAIIALDVLAALQQSLEAVGLGQRRDDVLVLRLFRRGCT